MRVAKYRVERIRDILKPHWDLLYIKDCRGSSVSNPLTLLIECDTPTYFKVETIQPDGLIQWGVGRYNKTNTHSTYIFLKFFGAGGRRFESIHIDDKLESLFHRGFFIFNLSI